MSYEDFQKQTTVIDFRDVGGLLGRGTGLSAATIEVSQTDDSVLRSAISQAAPGDTIHLSGFVALTNGELVINKHLAITGDNPNTAGLLVVSNVSRLIRIDTEMCACRASVCDRAMHQARRHPMVERFTVGAI